MRNSPTRVTHRDIAQVAGVNQTTVSRALRNHRSIPGRTRERIQALARKMGYRIDPQISRLMTHLSASRGSSESVIALISKWPEAVDRHRFAMFRQYYEGASQRAAALGFKLEEFSLAAGAMSTRRLGQVLKARGIEGILVFPQLLFGHISLDLSNYASATIGQSVSRPLLHRAGPDVYAAMQLALRECRRRGYKRIAFCLDANTDLRARYQHRAALAIYQCSVPSRNRIPPLILRGTDDGPIFPWLQTHRPDLLLNQGRPSLSWLRSCGFRFPKQMGYAKLNLHLNEEEDVDVAGIDQRPEEVGAAAIDLIVAQLHRNELGIPATPKQVLITPAWRDGNTVRSLIKRS